MGNKWRLEQFSQDIVITHFLAFLSALSIFIYTYLMAYFIFFNIPEQVELTQSIRFLLKTLSINDVTIYLLLFGIIYLVAFRLKRDLLIPIFALSAFVAIFSIGPSFLFEYLFKIYYFFSPFFWSLLLVIESSFVSSTCHFVKLVFAFLFMVLLMFFTSYSVAENLMNYRISNNKFFVYEVSGSSYHVLCDYESKSAHLIVQKNKENCVNHRDGKGYDECFNESYTYKSGLSQSVYSICDKNRVLLSN